MNSCLCEWTPTCARDGEEGGNWGVRSVKLSVPTVEILSTIIMVSDSFHFLPIMGLHCCIRFSYRQERSFVYVQRARQKTY